MRMGIAHSPNFGEAAVTFSLLRKEDKICSIFVRPKEKCLTLRSASSKIESFCLLRLPTIFAKRKVLVPLTSLIKFLFFHLSKANFHPAKMQLSRFLQCKSASNLLFRRLKFEILQKNADLINV
ncbi:hypothetical protein [uncultured Negativibacillus sp.]|uniref:hypothetical protein n=1 Tax=uncultured Negativibacillus sp. TaxID=1980696 RepID=UPI0025F399E2|nr:hypothetical protein [uncultured Negativibacillus sp.]